MEGKQLTDGERMVALEGRVGRAERDVRSNRDTIVRLFQERDEYRQLSSMAADERNEKILQAIEVAKQEVKRDVDAVKKEVEKVNGTVRSHDLDIEKMKLVEQISPRTRVAIGGAGAAGAGGLVYLLAELARIYLGTG